MVLKYEKTRGIGTERRQCFFVSNPFSAGQKLSSLVLSKRKQKKWDISFLGFVRKTGAKRSWRSV